MAERWLSACIATAPRHSETEMLSNQAGLFLASAYLRCALARKRKPSRAAA